MGGEPWDYYVPYRQDIAAALKELKEQEFLAGRYDMPDPGNPPASIAEAIEQMEADGTRSVLDMDGLVDHPYVPDSDDNPLAMVAPMSPEQLVEAFGTDKPTRADIARAGGRPEWVNRGMGVYVLVYDERGSPSEIYFAGCSFD